jgi:hypothetical protein
MASYLHEDEPLPARTTPQGTQANGVDHGHEERDVDFRAIVKWFAGLAISLAIIMPVVWFGLQAALPLIEGGDRPTSAVFAEQWELPAPRVLPNPFDSPLDRVTSLPQPLLGPAQYLNEYRRTEDAALVKLGLRYPESGEDAARAGLPRLPEGAVAAVISKAASAGASGGARGEPVDPMPAGYSGGTRMENRLR